MSVIELRGVNTHNKGAHLMMIAVADACSDLRLSTSPNGSDYTTRARLGLEQSLIMNQAVRSTAVLGGAVPHRLRSMFGLVSASDITGVLDAAGFAYSDSFGPERSRRESLLARRFDKCSVPRVFLPQAFGPFSNEVQAKWSRTLLESAAAVYARDEVSERHVRDLSPNIPVHRAPDFTVGLSPAAGTSPVEGDYIAIVPNAKVVSHGSVSRDDYVSALSDVARLGHRLGLKAVVVVHEFNDRDLAKAVATTAEARVFEHPDPLILKRVLADAQLVVGSRFHAVVSGLSSGVPVVTVGWSHKYRELLKEFGVQDLLVEDLSDLASRAEQTLDGQIDVSSLAERAGHVKQSSAQMWSQVRRLLGVETAADRG